MKNMKNKDVRNIKVSKKAFDKLDDDWRKDKQKRLKQDIASSRILRGDK